MPKATLSFNLPEETEEHYLALNGWAYKCVIEDLFQWLRSKDKSDNNAITTQEVRTVLAGSLEERSLDI